MISVELKRLTHLLNDMLDQSSSPEIATNFDLVLLVCDLVSLVRNQIADTISLEVQATQSYTVYLPETIFRQALLNLLLNAAEALEGSRSGHICIKIYKSKPGLTIQVLDDGAGFSQEILSRGIRSLRSCRQLNIGQGLAMAEQFIKNIGGSIKLSNQRLRGACVTLLLPAECVIETP